jgi:hypothetical protein
MGYKKASVTFWVPHTTLEKKVKCAENNPNHKPNVPVVTEKEPHFDLFVRTVLPHIWHFFYNLQFAFCNFSCQDVLLSPVQGVIGYFNSQRSKINTFLYIPFYVVLCKAV